MHFYKPLALGVVLSADVFVENLVAVLMRLPFLWYLLCIVIVNGIFLVTSLGFNLIPVKDHIEKSSNYDVLLDIHSLSLSYTLYTLPETTA